MTGQEIRDLLARFERELRGLGRGSGPARHTWLAAPFGVSAAPWPWSRCGCLAPTLRDDEPLQRTCCVVMPDDRSGSPGLQLDHAASHSENWTSSA